MRVVVDNSFILGESSSYKLKAPIQGLASSDIRTGSGLYAGRNLGFVSGQFLGYRTIVLNGFYIGQTCAEAISLRKGLFGTLQIGKSYELAFQGFDTVAWLTSGSLTDVKGDITSQKAGEFQLTFLCPDPILYKGAEAGSSHLTRTWVTQGVSGFTASTPKTVSIPNDGTVATDIKLRWSGSTIAGFKVVNVDTAQTFSLTTNTGTKTEIWFQNHRVLMDGQIRNDYLATTSQWFSIPPGGASLRFETTSTSSRALSVDYRRGGRLSL